MVRVDQNNNQRVAAGTLALLIALAGSAFAQSNGSISGTVQDSHGGVIPGAVVTVANPLGGAPGMEGSLPFARP